MTSRSASPVIIALLLVLAALFLTRSVMEPVAFALFVVALAAPLQGHLRKQMPGGLALLATVVVTLAVLATLGLTIFWGVGEIGHWVVGNIGRFQVSYAKLQLWLEGHDIFLPGLLAQRFEVAWVTGPLAYGAASLQSVIQFIMLAFVFIILGLKEGENLPSRI